MAPKKGRKGKSINTTAKKNKKEAIDNLDKAEHASNLDDDARLNDDKVADEVDPSTIQQQHIDQDEMPEMVSFNQSKEDAYKLKAEYSKVKQRIKDIRKEKQNRHQVTKAKEKSTREILPLDVLQAAIKYKDRKEVKIILLILYIAGSVKNSSALTNKVQVYNRKLPTSKKQTRNRKFRAKKGPAKGTSFVNISKDMPIEVSNTTSKFLNNRLFGTRITRNSTMNVLSNKYKNRSHRPAIKFKKT
ncbi:uncharacterized protein TRIADDRAFT_59463 [Trichoplax adhaerens]|uniref:Nucleolar protein 7 C-terminal domain-containing protein n=1 Tax=Trichoplax adhaerens TaxID=10228 RepID=B3S5S9_TRIAD|nr:predicted protein [Trichoplax adhaerens]EDV21847.1 predicted protein [Trichoplax adhaerens]|eukprot:XP_002115484.1 predicted protein [Trichoplax adhaerens]